MQVENYEPTERDILWSKAFASTPAGKRAHERNHKSLYEILEWRMEHEGFVPSPELMKTYEAWRAKHPKHYTNPHK